MNKLQMTQTIKKLRGAFEAEYEAASTLSDEQITAIVEESGDGKYEALLDARLEAMVEAEPSPAEDDNNEAREPRVLDSEVNPPGGQTVVADVSARKSGARVIEWAAHWDSIAEAAFNRIIDAKLVAKNGALDAMLHLVRLFVRKDHNDLADMPVPRSKIGNNADRYETTITTSKGVVRPGHGYVTRDFVTDTIGKAYAVELARINKLPVKSADTATEQALWEGKLTDAETLFNRGLRLYQQFEAFKEHLPLVSATYQIVRDKTGKPELDTNGMEQLRSSPTPIVVALKADPLKPSVMSITSFLSVKVLKAKALGGTLADVLKAMARETDPNAPKEFVAKDNMSIADFFNIVAVLNRYVDQQTELGKAHVRTLITELGKKDADDKVRMLGDLIWSYDGAFNPHIDKRYQAMKIGDTDATTRPDGRKSMTAAEAEAAQAPGSIKNKAA